MTTEMTEPPAVGFDDLDVLSTEGVDVFVLDLSEQPDVPPYYVTVAGRRFAFTATTFLVQGHGANLPEYVQEQEAAGNLVLFVQRGERYYAYLHDPNAIEEDEEGDEEAAVE